MCNLPTRQAFISWKTALQSNPFFAVRTSFRWAAAVGYSPYRNYNAFLFLLHAYRLHENQDGQGSSPVLTSETLGLFDKTTDKSVLLIKNEAAAPGLVFSKMKQESILSKRKNLLGSRGVYITNDQNNHHQNTMYWDLSLKTAFYHDFCPFQVGYTILLQTIFI